jgi:hypothetical protein
VNSRVDELQAGVLRALTSTMAIAVDSHCRRLRCGWKGTPTSCVAKVQGTFHQYARSSERLIQAWLLERGTLAVSITVPVHQQPAFHGSAFSPLQCRETERYAATFLAFPYPELTDDQTALASKALRASELPDARTDGLRTSRAAT